MSSSTIFDISNKALRFDHPSDLDPHISPLLPSSPDHLKVTEIRLHGNTIGLPAAERLATLLPALTSLQTVNFGDIFTSRLLSEIPPALSALLTSLLKCPNLRTVDLSDNAFGLNTVEPLVAFLKAHVPLQHLILNNNGMGPIAGARIAEALTELAGKKKAARSEGRHVPDLETVVCGRNRLEAGSMAAWAKAYTALGKVRTVRMTQNGIRIEGVQTLIRHGLAECEDLEVLDLQDNTFTEIGAKALADALPRWPALKELGSSDCLLKARGGLGVINMLGKGGNKKLRVLRLCYNEINAKGLSTLVAVAGKGGLPELRRVELNGNMFSEDDLAVEQLRQILDERKEVAGAGEHEEEDAWGIDELDEMEDEEDEDEDEGQEEAEDEAEKGKVLTDADQEEDQQVSQKKDKDVDDLADALGKQSI